MRRQCLNRVGRVSCRRLLETTESDRRLESGAGAGAGAADRSSNDCAVIKLSDHQYH